MDQETINNNFKYHAPTKEKIIIHTNLRDHAKDLVCFINNSCPDSREKSLAITHIENAVMWANAAVARYQLKSKENC